ncbi:SDR family NAD(P)-dependent oxidoreductase [Chryseobacterium gambrini]|uniref:SDR family NAD(P)-dependent oxidoreductase n=1 Tax=Chryseobacterium gambrini TaxID=373672 RepID=A0AAJ1R285_9FLAO|nr:MULTISPECIES: SDR family NAD(P)-dependent oxidoreductase [Chryseobacterium]MDN4011004.1 SDR family NAD(P)-dependent oxidoreductase [Chryseobacterium gambrini]MDN4028384.1 SDR family NAD(P)-dependent oxidoreductase [Chryseobacterium gambrini]QWA38821.1 SDR family NAD(P)-dependent oxidoreductase [Chryseobacterium sp. ZHDP1]
MQKTIFITGASKGFGKLWAEALLKRGDRVAASARNISALDDLKTQYGDQILPLQLDVNNRTEVFEVVAKIEEHFGKIDVLINNAGFGLFGTTEETSEQQAREQMETNFFGSLWVAQAVLPVMRKQKSGHIIQVSSFLGLTTLPLLGLYNASKFAVEGLIETIGSETAHLGIKTTLIEPNGFATDWAGSSAVQTSSEITDYNPVRAAFAESGDNPETWGKPEATVQPILDIIDNGNPPKRVLFGKIAYHVVSEVYKKRLEDIENWKEVSIAAHGH